MICAGKNMNNLTKLFTTQKKSTDCILHTTVYCSWMCSVNLCKFFRLKGRDSPTRFSTSGYFHHSNQSVPLTNRLKYFSILAKNSQSYRIWILSSKIWLPGVWGIIPRRVSLPSGQSRVNKKSAKTWLARVSISPGYDAPTSHSFWH